jgi:hypothetical protein
MTATFAPSAPLTHLDVCDRCGAQAYVRVPIGSGELLFCAHHGTEYMPALAQQATGDVQDERERLYKEQKK